MKVSIAICALLAADVSARTVQSWAPCTADSQCAIKGDMCCVAYSLNQST